MNEFILDFLYNLYPNQDTYEKNKSVFWSSRGEWNQNRMLALECATWDISYFVEILRKLMSDYYILGANWAKPHIHPHIPNWHHQSLMHFKDNSFDVFVVSCLTITDMFLKHLVACRPLVTKGSSSGGSELSPSKKYVMEPFQKPRGLVVILGELIAGLVMLEAQLAAPRRSSDLWCGQKFLTSIRVPTGRKIFSPWGCPPIRMAQYESNAEWRRWQFFRDRHSQPKTSHQVLGS